MFFYFHNCARLDATQQSHGIAACGSYYDTHLHKAGSVALVTPGGDYCTRTNQCNNCYGDCDYDYDCKSGLRCKERGGMEQVIGCRSGGTNAWDYCYDPNYGQLKTF
jgi:hypothetical protein